MLWDSKVKSYWFFFTFRRLKDTKVTKFTAPQIEEAATLEIQDYQKKKKNSCKIWKKILGCRDPRCKHENPSNTISNMMKIIGINLIKKSYIKVMKVSWNVMKSH